MTFQLVLLIYMSLYFQCFLSSSSLQMREMHSIHHLKKDDGIIVMVVYNKKKKEKKDKYDRI